MLAPISSDAKVKGLISRESVLLSECEYKVVQGQDIYSRYETKMN